MLLGKNQKPKQKPTSRFPISFQSITAIFQPILAIFHQFHVSGGGYGEPGFATGCHYARSPNTQRYIWFFFSLSNRGEPRSTDPTREWHKLVPRYFAGSLLSFCVSVFLCQRERERKRKSACFFLSRLPSSRRFFRFRFAFSSRVQGHPQERKEQPGHRGPPALSHRNVIEICAYGWRQRRHLSPLFWFTTVTIQMSFFSADLAHGRRIEQHKYITSLSLSLSLYIYIYKCLFCFSQKQN